MRLAIFSDIHGNPIALRAVLEDIEAAGGVDGYWALGDFSAIGYDPATIFDVLTNLPNRVMIKGNTDRYLLTGERPRPAIEAVVNDPSLMPIILEINTNFGWTVGYLAACGWLGWMDKLPTEARLTLPDGTRLLGVHASPKNDELGFDPELTDDECRELLGDCQADVVVCGHTHQALERRVDGVHIVNVGNVSNPITADKRASYVILEADEAGYRIEPRQVDYDSDIVMQTIRAVRHPAAAYLCSFYEKDKTS
ncbi:MAG: metallophosphoesterase family protein [Anaerolineales bacterium]|nr:metallophosphoesterase family protein [Anaerolineales bacterium]